MLHESNAALNTDSQKIEAPKHLKKGMLKSGEVMFLDDNRKDKVRKTAIVNEALMNKDEITSRSLNNGSQGNINERAAFRALVDESSISWETIGSKDLVDDKLRSTIRDVAREYLVNWRSTDSGKGKRIEACREKFRKIVQENFGQN